MLIRDGGFLPLAEEVIMVVIVWELDLQIPVQSVLITTKETDHPDMTEILLKVELK
jgi:hypothetical protein